MQSKFKSQQKGFTLIELLVVVAIISLLSSVVLASLRDSRDKAKLATFVEGYKQISLAVELYKTDNDGNYPLEDDFFAGALTPYIKEFPESPFLNDVGELPVVDYVINDNKVYFIFIGDESCTDLSSKYDKLLEFGWQQTTPQVGGCTNGFMFEF